MWLLIIIALSTTNYTPIEFMHPKQCEEQKAEIIATYPQAREMLACVAKV